MKTTIELPDDLVARAKRAALERKTTLRALVDRGLRRELGLPDEGQNHPLEGLATMDSQIWRGVEGDAYVAEQRSGWG
jgi:Arc/MetJ family transcription regulator